MKSFGIIFGQGKINQRLVVCRVDDDDDDVVCFHASLGCRYLYLLSFVF